jgi:hypothetical protein
MMILLCMKCAFVGLWSRSQRYEPHVRDGEKAMCANLLPLLVQAESLTSAHIFLWLWRSPLFAEIDFEFVGYDTSKIQSNFFRYAQQKPLHTLIRAISEMRLSS